MNTYEAMILAFQIFQAAGDVGEGLETDDGVIFAGPPPELCSPEQIEELKHLGWHPYKSGDCFFHFV